MAETEFNPSFFVDVNKLKCQVTFNRVTAGANAQKVAEKLPILKSKSIHYLAGILLVGLIITRKITLTLPQFTVNNFQ